MYAEPPGTGNRERRPTAGTLVHGLVLGLKFSHDSEFDSLINLIEIDR